MPTVCRSCACKSKCTTCIQSPSACSGNPAIVGATVVLKSIGALSVAVGAGGSHYTSAPAATFTISGTTGVGSGAAGTATVSRAGVVTAIEVTAAGSYSVGTVLLVTLTGGGGSGATGTVTMTAAATVGTCTTAGLGKGVASVTVPAGGGGTGYPGGTHPLSFSGGGGSGAAGTFSVLGGAVVGTAITAPGSGYSSPPAVAFPGTSGTPATGTAALTPTATVAQCCLPIPRAGGGYSATVSAAGYTTRTVNFAGLECAAVTAVDLTQAEAFVTITVTGCLLAGSAGDSTPLPGATVMLAGGTFSGTQTTGADGTVTFTVPATGTYTATVSAPDFATGTLEIGTPTTCSPNAHSIGLSPDAAHECACSCGPYPIPKTLFLTDSVYGGVTLVDTGTALGYIGSLTVPYPGGLASVAVGADPPIHCPPVSATINYNFVASSCNLFIEWTAIACNNDDFRCGSWSCPCGPPPQPGTCCNINEQTCGTNEYLGGGIGRTGSSCGGPGGAGFSASFALTNPTVPPLTNDIYAGQDATYAITS
jgi:hypothetical protein